MAGRGARGGGSWRDIASGGGNKSQDKLNPATTNGSGFSSHLKGSNVSNIDQRLLFTAQVLIGYTVQVTVKGGKVYEGIFHAIEVETEGQLGIILKMATTIALEGGKPLDMKGLAVKPEPTLLIRGEDLVRLAAKNVRMGAADVGPDADDMGFGTDSAISKSRGGAGLVGRQLEKWMPDGPDNTCLEDMALDETSYRGWDQFAVNSKMYGVESSFDEAIYTTTLDKRGSKISESEAARIAREIERGQMAPTNRHLAEERGFVVDDSGIDEEDKYSSVIRTEAPPKNNSKAASTPAWSVKGAGVAMLQGQAGTAPPPPPASTAPKPAAADSSSGPEKADNEAGASKPDGVAAEESKPKEAAPAEDIEPSGDKQESSTEDKGKSNESSSSDKKEPSEKAAGKDGDTASKPVIKSTLNVNAKPFSLNPLAKEFVPGSFSASSTASASNRGGSAGSSSSSAPSSSAGGSHKSSSGGGRGVGSSGGGGGHWNDHQQQQMMPGGWGPGGMQPGPGWGGGPGGMQPGMMGGMSGQGGRQAMMAPAGYGMGPRFPPQGMPPGGYYGQPGPGAPFMPHPQYMMMQPNAPTGPRGGPQAANGAYPPNPYGMTMGPGGAMGMQPDGQPAAGDH